ncbi:DUF397 domain-containing protein [Streptomyces sp. AV19]|uniref:DUF397 domain-containing protein n=1 Tax=Streptomyces sp. AV19 TaxID=2793068 RepID=UPI0018FEA31F|nr:DUF397 domain-containing protein [Streptomyces sp. AV19]MBH1938207.1 DUF397 domain-containing protein [Streptomyces sp. AV19]MDG4534846.1 DUF397 domain-containing protein [Streptomyces sp. AV19]
MSVQRDPSIGNWRKSSYSQGGEGCVEVPAQKITGLIPVRDSKDTGRKPIVFTDVSWGGFVAAVAAPEGPLAP